MYLSSTKYRPFYPQHSLQFDFTVSDYSSEYFQIGLSGNAYFYFQFRSGLITDHFNNLIGTFNGEPISISSEIKTGLYNYSLNSAPIVRGGDIGNESVFSSIAAKILDSNGGSINLDSYLQGITIPSLNFFQLYSNTGISGKLANAGYHQVKIYGVSSPDVTGSWQFPDTLNNGFHYSFYNNDVANLPVGTIISLNLETNFGNKTYSLKMQRLGADGSAEETPEIEEHFLSNEYVGISHRLGEPTPTASWESTYLIDYNIGPGNQLDLLFDYYQGRDLDIAVSGDYESEIIWSGHLFGVEGVASGTLFNTNHTQIEDFELDGNNGGFVTFSPTGKARYFEGLNPTGYATWEASLENFQTVLNDTALVAANYVVDLGGKYENFVGPTSLERTYTNLISYNGLQLYGGPLTQVFSGRVGPSDDGKHIFETVHTTLSGVTLSSRDLLYSSSTLSDTNSIVDLRPYRGVAFASLSEPLLISGESTTSVKPYVLLTNVAPTLLFKNLPNISAGGYHTFAESSVISGRILDSDLSYKRSGCDFSLSDQFFNAIDLPNSMVNDSISFYQNAAPFESSDEAREILIQRNTNNIETELSSLIDWNGNNFIALNKADDSNSYKFAFKSEKIPHVCLSFDKAEFLYSKKLNFIEKFDEKNLIPKGERLRDYNLFSLTNVRKIPSVDTSLHYGLESIDAGSETVAEVPFIRSTQGDLRFSARFKMPVSNAVQFIQLSWSDEVNPSALLYANFNLSAGSVGNQATNTAASITVEDLGWIRISIHLDVNVNRKLVFAQIRFVDSNTAALGANFSSAGQGIYIKDIQVENLNASSPSAYSSNGVDQTLTLESIFTYFLYKIHGIDGHFEKINVGAANTKTAFKPDSDHANITIDEDFRVTYYKTERVSTEGTDGYKIKEFFKILISYSFASTVEFFSEILFVSKRVNKNFFSLATDYQSLFIEDVNGSSYTTYNSSTIHGDAVAEILSVIRENSPTVSTEFSARLNEVALYVTEELPSQLFGDRVSLITSSELSSILFYGKINKATTAYIPVGYGRYYPNNTSSNSYGFFYETPSFSYIKSEAIGPDGYRNIFPNGRDSLNKEAVITVTLSDLKDYPLNRLVSPNYDTPLYQIANHQEYLNNGYFEVNVVETVHMTGTFEDAHKPTPQVWRLTISDSEDGTLNPTVIPFNEIDAQTYKAAGIAIANNTDRSKYLKVEYTKLDIEGSESDAGQITLNVISGVDTLYSVSKFLP